jgi:peptidoglycan-associated lipoprotein
MFSMNRILAFALLFCLFACSSKPKNKQDQGSSSGDGSGLVLNGSSDDGSAGGLRTVFFGLDSSSLDKEAKSMLKANADFLKANSSVSIQIEGHCDERGGRQYNLALGERRAKTVREYLSALGVKADRLSTISYGNERPMQEGSNESAWSKNRRANFVVTGK